MKYELLSNKTTDSSPTIVGNSDCTGRSKTMEEKGVNHTDFITHQWPVYTVSATQVCGLEINSVTD